jgi:hypothetical protein
VGRITNPPRILITPAQVTSIVWGNMQCIHSHCPMLLFSNQIADELNEMPTLDDAYHRAVSQWHPQLP